MSSRKRKKRNPKRLSGENGDRNVVMMTREGFSEEHVEPSRPKRSKITSSEPPELRLCQEITRSLTRVVDPPEEHCFPIRLFASLHSEVGFQGVPFAQFSVFLEDHADLEKLFRLKDVGGNAFKLFLLLTPQGEHFVRIELKTEVFHLTAVINPPLDWFKDSTAKALYHMAGKSQKHARLFLAPQNGILKQFCVEIWANEKLCEYHNPSELPRWSEVICHCKALVEGLYPGATAVEQNHDGEEQSSLLGSAYEKQQMSIVNRIKQFYEDVQQKRRAVPGSDLSFDSSSIPELTAVLRSYQEKAVAWMLRREQGQEEGTPSRDERPLHMFWRELPSGFSQPVYFNYHTGRFSTRRFDEVPWPRGGILADEMGLGKTVEILALILAHKWPGETDSATTDDRNSSIASCDAASCTQNERGTPNAVDGLEESGEERNLPSECTSNATDSGVTTISNPTNQTPTSPHSNTTMDTNKNPREENDSLSVSDDVIMSNPMEINSPMEDPDHLILAGETEMLQKIAGEPPKSRGTKNPEVYEALKDGNCEMQVVTSPPLQPLVFPTSTAQDPISDPSNTYSGNTTTHSKLPAPQNESANCLPSGERIHKDDSVSFNSQQDTVQCLCGATSDRNYTGEFVQCEQCNVWQHSRCADFNADKHQNFTCVKCLLDKPLPTGATLIISPQSIVQQWMEEIYKHTEPGALRVLHYRGVSEVYVSPFELASYDVVMVTYETLRTEVYHAYSHEVSRVLRHRKRYTCAPSPLPAVLWWRVCLDEAQMVESTNAKAAEMTQKLAAVNRWCVTGTPVQRNLLDLYGLVLFLGVDPYSQSGWFNKLLWTPFTRGQEDPMVSLFSTLMWRNSKADVAEELHLPDQSEEVHWLSFSPTEAYFYRRQQEICANLAAQVLAKLPGNDLTLSNLLQSTVHQLMQPLHSLRQACCHPQIVRGSYLPVNISNKNCLTMPELLEKLTTQAKQEAREALRQLVAALNGLAAVYIIKEEEELAVEAYREAMLSWQEHEEHLDCDKLQRIHTMENLGELLQAGHGRESHTLRDERLVEEAVELRSKYMEKPEGQVKAAIEALLTSQQAIKDAKRETPSEPWLVSVFEWAMDHMMSHDLVDAVKTEFYDNLDYTTDVNLLSFASFHDVSGLQFLLCTHMDKMESERCEVLESLDCLSAPPSPELVGRAAACHLRNTDDSPNIGMCELCSAEFAIVLYGRMLFARSDGVEDEPSTNHGDGMRKVHPFERTVRCILTFLRHKGAPRQLSQACQAFMDYFVAVKREYEAIRSLWITIGERLSMCDELRMAASRYRLMTPAEILMGRDIPSAFHPFEVSARRVQFESDKLNAKSELKKCLGRVLYLKNLAEAKELQTDNADPCPVCTRHIGREWGVFPCGHPLCMECVITMVRMQPRHTLWGYRGTVTLRCPLCRVPALSTEINYVRAGSREDDDIPIKGSHSTKIIGITRALLTIQNEDPGAKSLVFSAWQDVLELIAMALRDNGVKYEYPSRKATFQERLKQFKTKPDVNVLLLPVHSGSKGLNIVEATHVLLVEPSLNIGAELQAIGRVHRMGQTKATTVHRFYIRNTVEERIYELLNSSTDRTKFLIGNERESLLTLAELQELFHD